MTIMEIKKMYVDWMTGADDEIRQSDYLKAVFDLGLTDEEIDKLEREAEKELL